MDITDNFGISDSSSFGSVWQVIDAVNTELHLQYPRDLDKLRAIEEGQLVGILCRDL